MPETPADLYARAVPLVGARQFQPAADLLNRAMQLDPGHVESHYLMGSIFEQNNQLDLALSCYQRANALRPTWPGPYTNIGNVLRALGRHAEAIAMNQRAVEVQPHFVPGWIHLGVSLSTANRYPEALSAYDKALEFEPSNASAWFHRSVALAALHRTEEDIDACRRSIALDPDFPAAHNNLGSALESLGKYDEAIAAYREAIRLRPEFPESLNNLACILHVTGNLDESLTTFRQLLQLYPQWAIAHSNLIYLLLFHPGITPEVLRAEHEAYNRLHAQPRAHLAPKHNNDRTPDRPLRIGYVSADFRDHVVARNILPIFRCHDRSQFKLYFYMASPNVDAVTAQFQALADGWRDIAALSDDQAAALIQQDQIDILVDLSLHMAGNRLLVFARKPAPIQFTFAGYPGTTGLTAIDYRFTDPHLDPPPAPGQPDPADAHYSEKSLRLPHTFWVYDPLDQAGIPINDLPALKHGYITFGCLNNFCKLNDPTLARWSAILKALPTSRLHLLAHEGACRERTLAAFHSHGITSDRITFFARLPRDQYLRLYNQVDIALDTLPYNAHTTGLDALWMGVPTITQVGQTVAGRAGYSQLMNLALPELIAHNNADFPAIALNLALHLPHLTSLRQSLRTRLQNSPLMDALTLTRSIEANFRAVWKAHAQKP